MFYIYIYKVINETAKGNFNFVPRPISLYVFIYIYIYIYINTYNEICLGILSKYINKSTIGHLNDQCSALNKI